MSKHFATLDGIKRSARKLRRETGIPYLKALECTAREAGFATYKLAHSTFVGAAVPGQRLAQYSVTIAQYWRDRRAGARGTERRTIALPIPLAELVRPHHLVSYLSGDELRGDNDLVGYGHGEDRDHARMLICRMARTLQFMAATGLKPSRSHRCYPRSDWYQRPPGADHDHCWYDPATRTHVLTDEPYSGLDRTQEPEIREWCARHGFRIVLSRWGSVYGLGTQLYLASKVDGPIDIEAIAAKLETGEPPIQEKDWESECEPDRRTV
jgi:hypothetical protein